MRDCLTILVVCLALTTPMVQGAIIPSSETTAFIETKLCATGQLLRIPLNDPEDNTPPENHRACHAICARDQDEDESA